MDGMCVEIRKEAVVGRKFVIRCSIHPLACSLLLRETRFCCEMKNIGGKCHLRNSGILNGAYTKIGPPSIRREKN